MSEKIIHIEFFGYQNKNLYIFLYFIQIFSNKKCLFEIKTAKLHEIFNEFLHVILLRACLVTELEEREN